VVLAVALNGEALLRNLSKGEDRFSQLDAFSSGRLTLWTQAILNPPDNWLIGAGMGNARHHMEAVSIHGNLVKHLHNIWLDAWYETGALGLAMLVGLLLYVFSTTARHWKAITGQDRLGAALFLTGALTILAETQFSISYASREFGIYAFTCFAALLHLARRAASSPTRSVPHSPEN
jgi:teichuronic acid biosynthesis protein TuaE